MKRVVDPD